MNNYRDLAVQHRLWIWMAFGSLMLSAVMMRPSFASVIVALINLGLFVAVRYISLHEGKLRGRGEQRMLHQRIEAKFRNLKTPLPDGANPTELAVILATVAERPNHTVREIADLTTLSLVTTSRNLDLLSDQQISGIRGLNLIRYNPLPQHPETKVVSLTNGGRVMISTL